MTETGICVLHQCAECEQWKPRAGFSEWRRRDGKPRRRQTCRACRNAQRAAARVANGIREKALSSYRDMKENDPERWNYLHGATGALRRKYGLTPEQVEAMKAAQDGRCAICQQEPKKRLVVDHCHTTGRVRGLLCDGCNMSIGHLREDPNLFRRALEYLGHLDESKTLTAHFVHRAAS